MYKTGKRSCRNGNPTDRPGGETIRCPSRMGGLENPHSKVDGVSCHVPNTDEANAPNACHEEHCVLPVPGLSEYVLELGGAMSASSGTCKQWGAPQLT